MTTLNDGRVILPNRSRGLMIDNDKWPYRWAWNKRPTHPKRWEPGNRKGQRCRVLARGKMNSALVEFEDGYKTVTSRNGLRRAR